MTKEEAKKILDPETSRDALLEYEDEERVEAVNEACRVAVSALRTQQAKLDRNRWEGCDNCTAGDGEFRYLLGKWGDGDFCSRCGRPLTEQAWADLERRINDGTADTH